MKEPRGDAGDSSGLISTALKELNRSARAEAIPGGNDVSLVGPERTSSSVQGTQAVSKRNQADGTAGSLQRMIALRLSGELDQKAMRCALDRIVARHEVLRSVPRWESGPVPQLIP